MIHETDRHTRRRATLALLGCGLAANRASGADEGLERLEDWLRADKETRKKAVQQCLNRIRQRDGSIRAWVQVRPQRQISEGPLSGIPVGVKDIIETKNLVTEYGSPIYKGRQGSVDATIVRELQSLGAIVLGKTHAAAFAYRTPPPTRNPRNPDHTPGGSSSGSAAAVAAGMVPFTIGTQTRGSVLRPASYCGVTGFKPTYGLLPTEGVLPLAKSLDTLGFFTHTPTGMLSLWEALGKSTGKTEEILFGAVEPLPDVEPAMANAFRDAVSVLRSRKLPIEPVPIRPLLEKLVDETFIVESYEGARFHEERFKKYGDRLLHIAELVRSGLKVPEQRYREALMFIAQAREQLNERFRSTPVILTPAATGPAPKGLTSTGDSRMNAPWTAIGVPAISIPMPVTSGLPLGIQLTGAHGQDARVLQAAVRLAQLFGSPA